MQPIGPQGPPPGPPAGPPIKRQKPASMATYKRLLRKEIKRNAAEPEINFLNITAMLDMMTIILVFLLKTMSASSASVGATDLQMPKSVLTTEASQDGVPIIISKSHIIVGDEVVVDVPSDATHGVEAKYKRGGPNDLYITKIGQTVKSWRDIDRQVHPANAAGSEAIIIADANTPYRLLVEVLFTLGQNEFNKFHLMVLQGSKPGG